MKQRWLQQLLYPGAGGGRRCYGCTTRTDPAALLAYSSQYIRRRKRERESAARVGKRDGGSIGRVESTGKYVEQRAAADGSDQQPCTGNAGGIQQLVACSCTDVVLIQQPTEPAPRAKRQLYCYSNQRWRPIHDIGPTDVKSLS